MVVAGLVPGLPLDLLLFLHDLLLQTDLQVLECHLRSELALRRDVA